MTSNLRLEKNGQYVKVYHNNIYLGNMSLAVLTEFTNEFNDIEAIESYLEVSNDE